MKALNYLLLGSILLLNTQAATQAKQASCQGKIIVQAVESIVVLGKPQMRLLARMDTGATLSSIDEQLALKLGFNLPIRQTPVRNAHGTTIRPVVKISYILKGQKRTAEFTLAERSHLDYSVLLGRSGLAGFLVDPGSSKEKQ
jgi:hypothetical protein